LKRSARLSPGTQGYLIRCELRLASEFTDWKINKTNQPVDKLKL